MVLPFIEILASVIMQLFFERLFEFYVFIYTEVTIHKDENNKQSSNTDIEMVSHSIDVNKREVIIRQTFPETRKLRNRLYSDLNTF